MQPLPIVDYSYFTKNLNSLESVFSIKDYVFKFYISDAEFLSIVEIEKKSDSLNTRCYFERTEYIREITEKDLDVALNEIKSDGIYRYIFDTSKRRLVYEYPNRRLNNFFISVPESNFKYLLVEASSKDTKLSRLCRIKCTPEIMSMLNFMVVSRSLLAPEKKEELDNFGLSVAFILGNIERNFPVEKGEYYNLNEYTNSVRTHSFIPAGCLTRVTKIMDKLFDSLDSKLVEEKSTKEEEVIESIFINEKVVDIYYLSFIVRNGIPITKDNCPVDIDVKFDYFTPLAMSVYKGKLYIYTDKKENMKNEEILSNLSRDLNLSRDKFGIYVKNSIVRKFLGLGGG